jgi:hypothetical protein
MFVFHTVTEEDLISSMKSVYAIGSGVSRTAEQPEAIHWSDIGGLENAKVNDRFPFVNILHCSSKRKEL